MWLYRPVSSLACTDKLLLNALNIEGLYRPSCLRAVGRLCSGGIRHPFCSNEIFCTWQNDWNWLRLSRRIEHLGDTIIKSGTCSQPASHFSSFYDVALASYSLNPLRDTSYDRRLVGAANLSIVRLAYSLCRPNALGPQAPRRCTHSERPAGKHIKLFCRSSSSSIISTRDGRVPRGWHAVIASFDLYCAGQTDRRRRSTWYLISNVCFRWTRGSR